MSLRNFISTVYPAAAAAAALIQVMTVVASAQETSATIDNAQPIAVHQVGILRSGIPIHSGGAVPSFVHRTTGCVTSRLWLDFSALYLIPPQMTTDPKTIDVKQGVAGVGCGRVDEWYPYAGTVAANREYVSWQGVQVGAMADGLETTHPVWMQARAVDSAATTKVYKTKKLSPPTEPDDPGSTEGEVYLYMRAALDETSAPLQVKSDVARQDWVILPQRDLPASDNTVHAWMVQAKSGKEVLSRRERLAAADGQVLETRMRANIATGAETSAPLDLQIQLNEALVGNGLRPDEAGVLSGLVLRCLEGLHMPALVYIVPQEWTDRHIPLKIEGAAEKPLRVLLGIAVPSATAP